MKSSKKRIIKSLIESYRAKYPFLDEAEYKSLALKKYNEAIMMSQDQLNRANSAGEIFNRYKNQLGLGRKDSAAVKARILSNPDAKAELGRNFLTTNDINNYLRQQSQPIQQPGQTQVR